MSKFNPPTPSSTGDTYTFNGIVWEAKSIDPPVWEKSSATETGNTQGTTGGIAYYNGKSSIIKGALNAFYDETNERIGIGTSGPTRVLDVRGGITANGGIYVGGGATFADGLFVTKGITTDVLQVTNGATFGGDVIVDDRLTVGGAFAADSLQVTKESTFENNVLIQNAGDISLTIKGDTDNSGENDNPLVRLEQDGGAVSTNIGINGESNNQFTGAQPNAFYIEAESSSGSANQVIQFATDNNDRMTILGNGNVGINNSNPQELLHISGGGISAEGGINIGGGATFASPVGVLSGLTADSLQVVSGATFGGTVHFDEDTRFHGDLVLNEDGQIKVEGDSEVIKLNFGGGILDISANNVDIAKKLRHRGDPNPYIEFNPTDTVKFYAGGTNNIILTASETNFSDTEVTRPKMKDYSETFNDVGDVNSSTAFDFEDGNVQKCKVTGTDTGSQIVFSLSNPPASGIAGTMTVLFEQGNAHGDVAFHSSIEFPGGNAPTLTATSDKMDIISFLTVDGGTTYYAFVGGLNFTIN